MIDTIIYTKDNTHIENSYKVETRKCIRENCIWIIEKRQAMKYPTRSLNSYVNEWKGHNNLYNFFIRFKGHKKIDKLIERSKSVDLEERLTPKGKIKGIFMDLRWLIIGR